MTIEIASAALAAASVMGSGPFAAAASAISANCSDDVSGVPTPSGILPTHSNAANSGPDGRHASMDGGSSARVTSDLGVLRAGRKDGDGSRAVHAPGPGGGLVFSFADDPASPGSVAEIAGQPLSGGDEEAAEVSVSTTGDVGDWIGLET